LDAKRLLKIVTLCSVFLTVTPVMNWNSTGVVKAEEIAQPIPPLLITEIVANSANKMNDAGKDTDGFEYIEIYNNSDAPVSLKGYQILYYASSTLSRWNLTADQTVQPHNAMVLWVKSPNLTVTLDEFNASYGSQVDAGQFYEITGQGLSNSGSRRLILSSPDGIEISRAEYVGINDVSDNTSIVYAYPTDGSTLMRKVANKQQPTPGALTAGQAPSTFAPVPPANLTAVPGDREVSLNWTVPDGGSQTATAYRVYLNGKLTDNTVTGTTYTRLTGLTNFTTYTIALAAVNGTNQISVPSVVKAKPVPPVTDKVKPAAPVGLTTQTGLGEATLLWQPNTEADIAAYKIYKDGKLALTVSDATYSATVPALTGGAAYKFELTALDSSNNESLKSAPVTAIIAAHQPVTQESMGFQVDEQFPPFEEYLNVSRPEVVVPGLKQGLVPQGLDYIDGKDWFVISYYRPDKRPSVLSFVDAKTGAMAKSLHMYGTDGAPYNGHAGGVTVSRKHAWIANNKNLYQVDLQNIDTLPDNTNVNFTANSFPVVNNASFVTYANGALWSGDYYQPPSYATDPAQLLTNRDGVQYGAWLAGYKLDADTDNLPADKISAAGKPAVPDYILSVQGKIQGASFSGDDILLSYTTENAYSQLLKYKNPMNEAPHTYVTIEDKQVPVWFLDSVNQEDVITIPPYAEEIVVRNVRAYIDFESGSNTYSPYAYYPIDRLHSIDLQAWERYDKIYIEGPAAPMTHRDTGQLKVTHELGERGVFDVTSQTVFTSSNPAVLTVDSSGRVMAAGVGEATITAEFGGRTAAYMVQVQPKLEKLAFKHVNFLVKVDSHTTLDVVATYSDGSTAEVAAQSNFVLSNPRKAEVTDDGVLVAKFPGLTLLHAEFGGKRTGDVPVLVLPLKEREDGKP
jgi:hypothetical protein